MPRTPGREAGPGNNLQRPPRPSRYPERGQGEDHEQSSDGRLDLPQGESESIVLGHSFTGLADVAHRTTRRSDNLHRCHLDEGRIRWCRQRLGGIRLGRWHLELLSRDLRLFRGSRKGRCGGSSRRRGCLRCESLSRRRRGCRRFGSCRLCESTSRRRRGWCRCGSGDWRWDGGRRGCRCGHGSRRGSGCRGRRRGRTRGQRRCRLQLRRRSLRDSAGGRL